MSSSAESLSVAIVGATGYTGAELLRLLAGHPQATVRVVTSRQAQGQRVDAWFPNLRGHCDLSFTAPDTDQLATCDVVFFATPHGTAMHQVPQLLDTGVRVIDLSADFRLKDAAIFAQWYGEPHAAPGLLAEAVYGLPEFNRDQLTAARLVAAPGCYPTAVQLGFAPLLRAGLVDVSSLVADCKSGVSGAGRSAKIGSLLTEAGDSVSAYGVAGHRHLPEICQGLDGIAGAQVGLVFTPHLVPMIRGIHATLHAVLTDDAADLQALFEQTYADEPVVDVLPAGVQAGTRSVRGSNLCRIAVTKPNRIGSAPPRVVVTAVEDNLVKGASGQAIQAMNLMFGLDETAGLRAPALLP